MLKIIFMGTPDFADVSLKELIKGGYDICAVFSQPDKPVGRHRILTPPKTKITAQENGIKVYQPKSLKTEETERIIKNLNPDLIVVAAYGKILPKKILECAKMGCINVHASLLPKYRGAAPIQWSVINGDRETGITTMLMDEGLDTGDILLQETVKIEKNETSGELFEKMAQVGAKLLIKTINHLELNSLTPVKQDKEATYAPILDKSMAKIDFKKTSKEIHNLIRGLNPWPIAYTEIEGKNLKIYKSEIPEIYKNVTGKPGEVLSLSPFIVCCGKESLIEFKEVQIEGKKRMSSDDFIRGLKIKKEIILGGMN